MRISEAKEFVKATITSTAELVKEGRHSRVIVPMLVSVPGIGKTSVVEQATREAGGRLEVVRLTEYEPSEFAGWNVPDGDKMTRIKPMWLPNPDEGLVVIFLDELAQGATMLQNTAAQVINERRVGPNLLPDNAVVVAATNGSKDRAGTSHTPTHLRDRVCHLHIEPHAGDTIDYFTKIGVHHAIIGYLRFRPDHVSIFNRDADACPSPRSWERCDTLLRFKVPSGIRDHGFRGQIGEEITASFLAHLKMIEAVPSIDELIANPTTAPIPKDPGVLYAVAAALSARVDAKNLQNIITYSKRFERQEVATMILTDAYRRDRNVFKVPEFQEWATTVGVRLTTAMKADA